MRRQDKRKRISLADIERALKTSAELVRAYGEDFIPIFERLEEGRREFLEKQSLDHRIDAVLDGNRVVDREENA